MLHILNVSTEDNAEDQEQSHVSEKTASEKNRPDLTPENSDRLASRRNTEGRLNTFQPRRLFSGNDGKKVFYDSHLAFLRPWTARAVVIFKNMSSSLSPSEIVIL